MERWSARMRRTTIDYFHTTQHTGQDIKPAAARMVGGGKGSHPECHFAASGVAAIINFPLWRAAAIGQSGFDKNRVEHSRRNKNFLRRYAMGYTALAVIRASLPRDVVWIKGVASWRLLGGRR